MRPETSWPIARLIVCAALLIACGANTAAIKPTTTPATGHEIAPVVIMLSTFWETLDNEACPLIAKRAKSPTGFDEWWPGLRTYCATRPGPTDVVTIAAEPDREARLASLLAEMRGERKSACSNLPALPNAPALRQQMEQICSTKQPTQEQIDALVEGARKLGEITGKLGNLGSSPKFVQDCNSAVGHFTALGGPIDTFLDVCATSDVAKAKATVVQLKERVDGQAKAATEFASSARTWRGDTATLLAPASTMSSSVGLSPFVDVALQGLAQFLVKRAELELRAYAIDKLRKIAQCKEALDTSVVHRLLRNSCEFLGSETGTLTASFGPGLRDAFVKDLSSLPRNVVREVPGTGNTSALLARVGIEAIAVLVDDPDPMQLVVRVEQLTRNRSDERFTCTVGDTNCLDTQAFMYLGAYLAREALTDGATIRINGHQLLQRFSERLTDIAKELPEDSKLAKTIKKANLAVDELVKLVASLENPAQTMIDHVKAARAALATVPIEATFEVRAKAVVNATRHALSALDRAIAIATCIERVIDTKQSAACTTERSYIPSQITDFLDGLARKDIVSIATTALSLAKETIRNTKLNDLFTADLNRLLSFGAELANAKTKEEAAAAIEAIAMPPGGYKEKRKRDFFSITGLVGMSGAVEWLDGAGKGWTRGYGGSVTGMVGLDYNVHSDSSAWTYGAFLGVIDLGGIINFGVHDDNEKIEQAPTIGFSQVFAPTLGFRLGVSTSPVVFMAGFQLAPNARTVTTGDNATPLDPNDDPTEERSAIRAMLTIAVDVTLWAF